MMDGGHVSSISMKLLVNLILDTSDSFFQVGEVLEKDGECTSSRHVISEVLLNAITLQAAIQRKTT